jgi:hypothetical protein
MSALQKISSMGDPASLDGQLLIEAEFQRFFKKTPPLAITNEFRQLSGSVENQIYLLNLALKVIEELDVEPVQAYGLLEAVRPVIYEKFKILTSRFIGKSLLARTKANLVVFNAIDLYTRLTATYDSVIDEAKYFGDSQAFIMGSAIHRAMSDKTRLIQSYLLLYMDIPDQIWKHLNSLYLTADEFNIQNQVISDAMLLSEYQFSIRQLYSYALLLSTCEMRNLHVVDIKSVSEFLKPLIKSVVLKPRVLTENCIYMDPALILKPARYREGESLTSDKSFSFDLRGIEKAFTKKYNTQIMVDGERCTLSPQLLERIYQLWTQPFVRSEERSIEPRTIIARPGFSVNWMESGCAFTKSANEDEPTRDYRGLKLDLSPALESLPFAALKPVVSGSKNCYQPVMIDSSKHGFCLVWDNSAAALIHVGELVVINDITQSAQLLCQILWAKGISKDTIKTGLRILATCIIPVLAKPHKNPGQPAPGIARAFLSATNLGDKLSYSLIVEKRSLTTGHVVTLLQDNKSRSVQMLEQYIVNQDYQSFSVGFYDDRTTTSLN